MESGKLAKSEVEQLFKLLVQGDAQDQRQLCGGVKLPCFNGADGVPAVNRRIETMNVAPRDLLVYHFYVSNYDEFALYGASRLCVRLRNPKQFELNAAGVAKLPQIKSILNYVKTVIYPYKVDFEQEYYSSLADDIASLVDNNFDFSEYLTEGCKVFSQIDFTLSLENITNTVRSFVSKIPKKNYQIVYMKKK